MKLSSMTRGLLHRFRGQARVGPATRAERGQALVVIALAMIGLLAFVGLTIDSGILFIGEGHLRRAVDAAALAAAAQFRVGRSHDQLRVSAEEVVHLNGVDPTSLVLTLCDPTDPVYDDTTNNPSSTLCTGPIHRKVVKIVATTQVRFAFLGIIGIPSTQIVASSVSETASVDVVLVIDTSNSMTFDCSTKYINCSQQPTATTTSMYWPSLCNTIDTPDPADPANPYKGACLPFDQVKHAAVDFVHHLYWPYDRLAIVTFDQEPKVVQPLTNTLTVADWVNTIKGLQVSDPRDPNQPFTPASCTWNHWAADTGGSDPGADPSGCTNTSTGGGLRLSGGEFGRPPIRQESVWVVILLTDGAANASVRNSSPPNQVNQLCPPTTWRDVTTDPWHYDPFCRDWDKTTRHTVLNPNVYVTSGIDPTHTVPYNPQNTYDVSHYDSDDYARDNADFVACPAKLALAPKWCRDSLDYSKNLGGQGALIYSIGLGKLVIDNSSGGGVACGVTCENRIDPNDPDPVVRAKAGYDAGDYLLRYIANVGSDGNPDPSFGPDPCQSVAPPRLNYDASQPPTLAQNAPTLASSGNLSYNCGNYYFSQTGTGLTAVFQSIASRIFTRISQ